MAARPPNPKRSRSAPPEHAPAGGPERLQKVLAAAGLGSRRECETYIVEGRVDVDGAIVTELGTKVDPARQRVRVDGVPLPRTRRLYYAVHKPPGVVSTNRDPSGRTRVVDLIETDERLFTVGRLDRSSEGLILVTNDGDFANRLAHPRYEVEKVYRVIVAGQPTPEAIADLRRGVHLAEGLVRVDSVRITKRLKHSTELEVVLKEGLNREIRRLLARIGHKVLALKRIAIGTVRLADLPLGAFRPLTRTELARLMSGGSSARQGEDRPASDRGRGARRSQPGGSKKKAAPEAGRPAGQGSVIGGESVRVPRKRSSQPPSTKPPARRKTTSTGATGMKATHKKASQSGGRPSGPGNKAAYKKAARKTVRKKHR